MEVRSGPSADVGATTGPDERSGSSPSVRRADRIERGGQLGRACRPGLDVRRADRDLPIRTVPAETERGRAVEPSASCSGPSCAGPERAGLSTCGRPRHLPATVISFRCRPPPVSKGVRPEVASRVGRATLARIRPNPSLYLRFGQCQLWIQRGWEKVGSRRPRAGRRPRSPTPLPGFAPGGVPDTSLTPPEPARAGPAAGPGSPERSPARIVARPGHTPRSA